MVVEQQFLPRHIRFRMSRKLLKYKFSCVYAHSSYTCAQDTSAFSHFSFSVRCRLLRLTLAVRYCAYTHVTMGWYAGCRAVYVRNEYTYIPIFVRHSAYFRRQNAKEMRECVCDASVMCEAKHVL